MAGNAASASTTPTREIAPDVFCLGPWGRTQTVVYFVRSGSSWVLIDTGWAADAARIEQAAAALTSDVRRPSAILLTHCHPDHAGAARELALAWDCPVYLHPQEAPIANGDFPAMTTLAGPLDRWLVLPLLRAMGRTRRAAILAWSALGDVVRTLDLEGDVPELPGWRCPPRGGHTLPATCRSSVPTIAS
jgi:glyoxylase-like metal-dependent hydrolase (beta-lactamase superfamily II)